MKIQGIIHGDHKAGYWLDSEGWHWFSAEQELLNYYQQKGITVLGKAFSGTCYVFDEGQWTKKSQCDLWN